MYRFGYYTKGWFLSMLKNRRILRKMERGTKNFEGETKAETDKTGIKDFVLARMRQHEQESFAVEFPARRKFESIREVFPRFIWEQVEEDIALIEDAAPQTLNPAKLEIIAQALASERHEKESLDALTGLYSQKYMKEVLTGSLLEQMRNQEINSFDHIIRISLDINGLKAVNDYHEGQHSKGDEYLKLVARGLRNSQTIDRLRLSGCRVIIAREHGDDFSITIIGKPDGDYDENSIRLALQHEVKAGKIPETLISHDILEKAVGPVPKNFEFYPSAAAGSVSVETILTGGLLKDKNAIEESDTPKRTAQKIMGALIDESESLMKHDKNVFKRILLSGSALERYYLQAISPRDQELLADMDSLQQIVTAQSEMIGAQKQLISELKRKLKTNQKEGS